MEIRRLDKIITDAALATRSEAKKLIKSGKVTVDGVVCKSADMKFDCDLQQIRVEGKLIVEEKLRYFVMNKPTEIITATEDREQKTVLDILPNELKNLKLFPVGRLDKDTTGLLILTNDGDFTHKVISPKKHVPKVYLTTHMGTFVSDVVEKFEKGVELADGTKCLPARIEILSNTTCEITIFEGKYHQVKRMVAACGSKVSSLHRLSIGELYLPKDLKCGEIIELTSNEAEKALSNKNIG